MRTRSTASTPCMGRSSYFGATTSNGILSCSRIARRRGDVDARSSGGAGGASATLSRLPDVLPGPAACPVDRNPVSVARRRVFGRTELDQRLELESLRPQQPNPFAVRQLELDRAPVGLFAVHPEVVV